MQKQHRCDTDAVFLGVVEIYLAKFVVYLMIPL